MTTRNVDDVAVTTLRELELAFNDLLGQTKALFVHEGSRLYNLGGLTQDAVDLGSITVGIMDDVDGDDEQKRWIRLSGKVRSLRRALNPYLPDEIEVGS